MKKRIPASRMMRHLTHGLKEASFFPKTEREQDLFVEIFNKCLMILRKHDAKMLRRAARLADVGTL